MGTKGTIIPPTAKKDTWFKIPTYEMLLFILAMTTHVMENIADIESAKLSKFQLFVKRGP